MKILVAPSTPPAAAAAAPSPRHTGPLLLGFCVIGIYSCFLVWGYLQEKLTTTDYSKLDGTPGGVAKFDFFIFMNLVQSLIACACAAGYAAFKGVDLSLSGMDWNLGRLYLVVGLTSALASPIGYSALQFLNFPTVTLSKSCKLVPVMLVQVVVYRKPYPMYKYLSVALITLGVSSFFLLQPTKGSDFATNSLYGILLITTNLLLDGFTNSTEDVIFKNYKSNSTQLMFFLNLAQSFLMALWLLNPFNPELVDVFRFFQAHPQSLFDLVIFSLAGAMGQTAVFLTLEQFGSLTLVTITVTRKLFSIVLSVVAFGHQVSVYQVFSVLVVFFGIGMEAFMKQTRHHSHGPGDNHNHGHNHSHNDSHSHSHSHSHQQSQGQKEHTH